MFSNSSIPSRDVDEGTVVQVDPIRKYCKVRTLKGQALHSVGWVTPYGGSTRAGDRFCPSIGDRVMLHFGLGYPVITGFLSKVQSQDGAHPLSLLNEDGLVDTGNYSTEGMSTRLDMNSPRDSTAGDRIFSTVGGAILGLLRTGTVLLRASRAAEILMSPLHALVRIVSRNFEHMTDVHTDVVNNRTGRGYRYTGYARTFQQSKIEDYNLHYYYGDTAAAETIKTAYGTFSGAVPTSPFIYKEQVTDRPSGPSGASREVMRRTLNLAGEEEVWIYNGTNFIRVTTTAEEFKIGWNDVNTVTLNELEIHAVHKDGADYIMDASGIRATFKQGSINMSDSSIVTDFGASTVTLTDSQIHAVNGGSNVTLTSSDIQAVNGGSNVTLTSSNITATNGGGKLTVTSSQSKLENGGHAITITPAGVSIT